MTQNLDRITALPIAFVLISDGCNSKCITCDIWKSPRRNMDMNLVASLASEFKELGVKLVGLSGGEAMQHPEWPKIASLFRESGARVLLFTNGLYLRKQIDQVVSSVDSVTVSLDAADAETYQKIRGVNAFQLVLEGMKAVAEKMPSVMTRTTIQRLNFRQLPQIIDVALANGAGRVSFLTIDVANAEAFGSKYVGEESNTGQNQNLNLEEIKEFSRIIDQLEKSHKDQFKSGKIAESPEKLRGYAHYFLAVLGHKKFKPPPCNSPQVSVSIEVDGSLRPCFFLPIGAKVGHASLQKSLNEEKMMNLRREFQDGKRKECERCVCPLLHLRTQI